MRICHQLVSIQSLLRLSGNLRFLFEVTLVRLSQMRRMIPLEELAESLKKNSGPFPPRPLNAANPPPVRPAASAPQQPAARPAQAPIVMADDFFAVFISVLEVINSRLAAALEHASFIRTESKVSFYVPETVYAMIKLDQKTQSDLEGLLQRKLGESISVEIHRGNPPSEKEASKVSTPETLVENDPLVKEFVKTFKGRISKIELNKERYS